MFFKKNSAKDILNFIWTLPGVVDGVTVDCEPGTETE